MELKNKIIKNEENRNAIKKRKDCKIKNWR